MSRCCIILNNMLKKLPVMMEAGTGNLIPLDYKKSFYCPIAMRLMTLIKLVKLFVLWSESDPLPIMITNTSIDTPCPPEVECLVTTVSVTSETTNSNSLLPNTALNDIQQHVNSANSGDVDIRNLTVTLIRTVVLQRSWYQMQGCSVQWKMKKNTHGYMTMCYTNGIYVSFVNCFVVILPHHKNLLLLALTLGLVQYDHYSITGHPN